MKIESRRRGPFFQGDPGRRFRENARISMRQVARDGARRAIALLRAGQGRRRPLSFGGRVADHVIGRTASLSGNAWKVTAVVSVNAAGLSGRERVALYGAAARVERETHAFREATESIRRIRFENDLLAGIHDGR